MAVFDRGGRVIKTGKIGQMNVLRQQLIAPGEVLDAKIVGGACRLSALREEGNVFLNSRIDAFVQPLRWLVSDWPKYLRTRGEEGTIPTLSTSSSHPTALTDLGLGGTISSTTYARFWRDAVLRIYNEWYKWPEHDDATAIPVDGHALVPLGAYWSRIYGSYSNIDEHSFKTDDISGSTREHVDLRKMVTQQGKFETAMRSEYLSHDRYMDYIKSIWGADGSAEVDKVPRRLNGSQMGVEPSTQFASDGASMGQTMSIYDFGIKHDFGKIVMPEHAVVTYVLANRYESVAQDEINPMTRLSSDWNVASGNPITITKMPPQSIARREIHGGSSTDHVGYLPAGWQWRARWNMIGNRYDARNTIPAYQDLASISGLSDLRDARRVNNSFYSSSLGDYIVDVMFQETSRSMLQGGDTSVLVGSGASTGSTNPYPTQRHLV